MEVHVICWDGIEYDRETDEAEIAKMEEDGYFLCVKNGQLVFDFSIMNK